MKKKIIVFGLGKMFKSFMQIYDEHRVDIVAVCDNNPNSQSTFAKVYNRILPEQISSYEYEYVVITSSYFNEIKSQLIGLGINESRIMEYAGIYNRITVLDEPVMELLKADMVIAVSEQKSYAASFRQIANEQKKALFLTAKCFSTAVKNRKIDTLEEVEFRVFSQWGEDGIIQWLINNTVLDKKIFVEFGVEDYVESNTRFLLMNNNWAGLVIDGSEENVKKIRQWDDYWKYDLRAVSRFITRDNINSIISENGIEGDIGILSVDIDGNDYWVLDSIACVRPRILVCEYNNIFGADKKVTVPYDEKFFRTDKHFSNLYWGCSLGALCDWAERNGFYYMGSNSAGNNAFFVRKDCISPDMLPEKRNVFVESRYRESRDGSGKLTYLRGEERLDAIKEMKLWNLENGRVECIKDIYNM